MLSKLKNMPGVAWLVIGVCVTALVMPTAAFAAGITWNGIEGQNKNKADVTAQGQLETAPADLSSSFETSLYQVTSNTEIAFYSPPSGEAAVITSIHVSSYSLVSGDADPYLTIGAGNGTVGGDCGTLEYVDEVDPSADGVTVLPYSPGYVIPAGDTLCAWVSGMDASVVANGYLVPAADAPTSPQTPAGPAPSVGQKQ